VLCFLYVKVIGHGLFICNEADIRRLGAPSQPDGRAGVQLVPSHTIDREDKMDETNPSLQVYRTVEP